MKITDKTLLKKWLAEGRIPKDAAPAIKSISSSKSQETKLRQLLIEHFGDHKSGGDVCFELCSVIPGRNFRFDAAILSRYVLIELDGYVDHGLSLAGFKRDRLKDLLATQQGWHVLHVTSDIINNQPELLINAIHAIPPRETKPSIRYKNDWTYLIPSNIHASDI